jgi:hypothetical protein
MGLLMAKEKMLANVRRATSWVLATGVNGAAGEGFSRAVMRLTAASMAAPAEVGAGMAHVVGKNSTVSAICVARVLAT